MKYGINSIGPKFFNGAPDLAVTGPNVSPKSYGNERFADFLRLVTILAWRFCSPGL